MRTKSSKKKKELNKALRKLGCKRKFWRNVRRNPDDLKDVEEMIYNDFYNSVIVDGAFNWSNTLEGFDFWNNINNKLDNND